MQLANDEENRRRRLLEKIEQAAAAGADYVQLRERDLTIRALELLAKAAVGRVRGTATKMLINSRVDVAISVGADGVHLRSTDLPASEVRAIWAKSTGKTDAVIGVSCHSLNEVLSAEGHGADFAVFGPVFGKQGSGQSPVGLDVQRTVAHRGAAPDKKIEAAQLLRMPIFALGGVSHENAGSC